MNSIEIDDNNHLGSHFQMNEFDEMDSDLDNDFNDENLYFNKQGWTEALHYSKTSIEVNGVEQELLMRAKEELKILQEKWKYDILKKKKNEKTVSLNNSTKKIELYDLWVSHNIRNIIYSFSNESLANDVPEITLEELDKFFIVNLFLAFYGCSPSTFYHKNNCTDTYNDKCLSLLSKSRFFQILQALKSKKKSHVDKSTLPKIMDKDRYFVLN